MESQNKYTTITLPTPLAKKLKERIEGTGFSSLSSYVTYILRQLLATTEKRKVDEVLSNEQEEKIKANLRALGYIE